MQQIADWLDKLGMSEYTRRFVESDIDVSVLPYLTDQDLKDVGVSLGHRRKMLAAIAGLAGGAGQPSLQPVLAQPKPQDTAERRQVTVMFSDLVGSTALSARMDPEDLREVISAYQKCAAEIVRRSDGYVAQYLGDGVLVYFGYPQAHEDDAERAVRAGLELIAALRALKTRVSLQTRVGVATGLVVVGDLMDSGNAPERSIVGETPNVAARLQGIAEPNMVVIAESTRKLLGNLFELVDLGAKDLKGIAEPVRAWAALRPRSVESRFDALHASGLTALVGREEEFELLLRRWSRAKGGEGQVVLLCGEPGIGKSRLTAALLESVAADGHIRLRYLCSPQHADSALYPIIGQIERAAGLAHDDAAQARLDKLDAVLARTSASIRDAALFAEMLSLPNDGRYPALELTPQQRRQGMLEAFATQFAALASQQPVLMMFEDVHWIDPTSLEALNRTVDRIKSVPALLIVTFRPEFHAPWAGQSHVTSLMLNRLGQRDVAAIVTSLAGNKNLPEYVTRQVVERSDGIPLFVEEMTKAVLEADSEATPERLTVPASLHASLMARLDRLGPIARETMQLCAVIGREFSYELLLCVCQYSEAELREALRLVVSTGLVFQQGAPPSSGYLFKHALVQDTAYSTLLRGQRQELHLRIARALEERFPTLADTQPEILAHHFTQAGLPERSVVYRLRAGKNAAARSANIEAISQLHQGIETVSGFPDEAGKDRLELDLQFALGPCLIATKGATSDEAVKTFTRARELCRRVGHPIEYPQVMHWLTIVHAQRGELREALDTATATVGLAEAGGHRPALVNSTRGQALILLMLGRLLEAREVIERNVLEFEACDEDGKLATRTAGQDAGTAGLSVMAWGLWALGYADLAAARMAAAVRRADAIAHPHTRAYASYYASVLHALRREPNVAYSHAERCLALSDEHGFGHWRTLASAVRWSCTVFHESALDSLAAAQPELSGYAGAQYQLGITALYLLLSEALIERREPSSAFDFISKGLQTTERTNERLFEGEFLRLQAHALIAQGAASAAENAQVALQKALMIAHSQHARSLELRAARDLARLWRNGGKRDDARDLLAPIYGWFTEGFDTLDLKEAKALLSALAS